VKNYSNHAKGPDFNEQVQQLVKFNKNFRTLVK